MNQSTKYLLLALLLYALISVISVFNTLISPGVISYRFDWDIPPYSQQFATGLSTRVFSWNPQQIMGIPYTVAADAYYWGFLSIIGQLGGEFVSKLLLVLLPTAAGLGMFLLTRRITSHTLPSWVAGLFYMFTPYVFLELLGGHLPSIVSYSLSPFFIITFLKAVDKGTIRWCAISGVAMALAATYIDYMVLLPIAATVLAIFYRSQTFLIRIKTLFITIVIFSILHSFWLLPIVWDVLRGVTVLRVPEESVRQFLRIPILESSSYPLIRSFRLDAFFYFDLLYPFTRSALWVANSLLVPVIAFFALVLKPRNRMVIAFSILAILSVLLVSGTTTFFAPVYRWLLFTIPYMAVFTSPFRWMPLMAISYGVLIAITVSAFSNRILTIKYPHFQVSGLKHGFILTFDVRKSGKKTSLFLVSLIVVSIIAVFQGPFFYFGPRSLDSQLGSYQFDGETREVYDFIASQTEDFRIANYPLIGEVGPNNSQYATQPHIVGADPMGVYPPKPAVQFAGSNSIINHAGSYTRILSLSSYYHLTNQLDKLLGLSNVKYVLYYSNNIDNTFSVLYKPYLQGNQSQLLSEFLDAQEGLKIYSQGDNITLYENTQYVPHIYAANQLSLVSGDPTAMLSLVTLPDFDMNNSLFAFSRQLSPEQLDMVEQQSNQIILYENNYMDLITANLPKNYRIQPGPYTGARPDLWLSSDSEWWVRWGYPAGPMLNNVGAYTPVTASLTIPFTAEKTTSYEIWVKAYQEPQGGLLQVDVDNKTLGTLSLSLKYDLGYQWFSVNSTDLTEGNHNIVLTNLLNGLRSAVAEIIVVPTDTIENARQTVYHELDQKYTIILGKCNPSASNIVENLNETFFVPGMDNANVPNYEKYVQNDDLYVIAPFNKASEIVEGVLGHINFTSPLRNLNSIYLNVDFQVDNPAVQFFEAKYEVDTNNDGQVDLIIPWGQPLTRTISNQNVSINIGHDITSRSPGIDIKSASIIGLTLVFQKMYDADLSASSKQYTYIINNISWNREQSMFDVNGNLGFVTGESDNSLSLYTKSDNSLSLFTNGNYSVFARLKGQLGDTVRVAVDDSNVTFVQLNQDYDYEWVDLGSVLLNEGNHQLSLISDDGVYFDSYLVTHGNKESVSASVDVQFKRIRPTEYEVVFNSNVSYLVFVENFDKDWKLYSDTGVINPLVINSFANGYYVENMTSQTLKLVYGRQVYFDIGFIVTGIGWLVVGVILINRFSIIKKIVKKLKPSSRSMHTSEMKQARD